MALIDIAKNHTTGKTHKDVGMRVADYPTIQDYVGEAIIDTNACRAFNFLMAQAMDGVTNNCDWSIHKDLEALPRAQFLHWMWQVKFAAAKNVAHVTDKMLHACGGTGYKPRARHRALSARRQGRLGDGPDQRGAAPVRRQVRRSWASACLDYWNQSVNERVLNNEIKKMTAAEKQALAKKLLGEARPGGGVTIRPTSASVRSCRRTHRPRGVFSAHTANGL